MNHAHYNKSYYILYVIVLLQILCICFTVAARVVSKPRTFKKNPLQFSFVQEALSESDESDSEEEELQFARQEKGIVENFKRNQLAVHGLPEGVTKDFYEVVIGGCLNMDEGDDFELDVSDSSAVITFAKDYSTEGTYIQVCDCAHGHPP